MLYSLSLTTCFAQQTLKTKVSSSESTQKINKINSKKDSTSEKNYKEHILGEWKFHSITIETPKDGYIMRIGERELAMISLLVSNYNFISDGNIIVDEKYKEKQGVDKVKWELSESKGLKITYVLTTEKQKEKGYSQAAQELVFSIVTLSNKELIINTNGFILNLIKK